MSVSSKKWTQYYIYGQGFFVEQWMYYVASFQTATLHLFSIHLSNEGSQPKHYRHFGQDKSLWLGMILCLIEDFAPFLFSAPQIPTAHIHSQF